MRRDSDRGSLADAAGPGLQLSLFDAARTGAALPADEADWRLRRSVRARRLTVRVFHDGRVVIVVPQRASERRVREFVREHRQWIAARVAEALATRARRPVEAFPPQSIALLAFGEHWRLHLAGGRGAPRVRPAADGLLEVRGELDPARGALRARLLAWLIGHARTRLEPQLADLSRASGLRYSRLSLRRQRSRWGSCSVRGTISLNVCLAFQRPEVVRYLMLHELVHTRHMNHSAAYWDCVAGICPGWQALDRELTDGWRLVPQWVFA
ncbi:MAG: SprT family zinc-dependent metalloprotease [Steroidobacteraceae bacterium]